MLAFAPICKKCFERLASFFKRRWILLSFAVVITACSFVDIPFQTDTSATDWRMYGVHRGCFFWCVNTIPQNAVLVEVDRFGSGSSWAMFSVWVESGIRRPMLGELPWYDSGTISFSALAPATPAPEFLSLGVPIWIPLSVVVGWIVFRELRWREKSARKAEQP